jgi:hypothetical protein
MMYLTVNLEDITLCEGGEKSRKGCAEKDEEYIQQQGQWLDDYGSKMMSRTGQGPFPCLRAC